MNEIYLDHAATTPMSEHVIAAMTEAMRDVYGNASSIHGAGRTARKALDEARATLARSIGAKPNEILLTSGGTEADNTAIFGVAAARQHEGKHIITTQIEHHAVLHACAQLEKQGYDVTYLPVNEKGVVAVKDVQRALRDDTILVTIMYGNNEVGSVQPIAAIGELLQAHTATFHTDAVQAYGIVPLDVDALRVDLLSVSAHKLNGPKGIGFLYVRAGVKCVNLLYGGSQERKRRAGTENVPAAVGFAVAVDEAIAKRDEANAAYKRYRELLTTTFTNAGLNFRVNGEEGLLHVLNVTFVGTDVESFLINLDMSGVLVSSGSACTAGAIDPSHVLVAMFGSDAEELRSSIRFSFGQGLSDEIIQEAANRVVAIVQRLVK
ncbi:cysteine desulfurase family protein [Caryophanon latum]|uniref:cysteine desulfurase n=1 Tax=Caryophanon latum TaxID=33977 RepID=A0A1C0Z5K8_9BACL|nr:cysteine desulfurase family protein [Caryophanon latum]OCS94648.1 cysteine desulfurase NifS [Caryophanon latum]